VLSSSSSWLSAASQGENLPCYITQVNGYTILLADGSGGALWLAECPYDSSSSQSSSPYLAKSTLVRGYLYWKGKRRDTAFVEAVLDLSEPDKWTVRHCGPVQIQLGGTFEGVTIPYETLACVDGTVLRVCIGKVPAKLAQSVGKAWYEAMVMRVRATLEISRAAAPRWPGNPFEVL
jgi:hypothetical protein